jgi:hypothetical protein
VDEILKLVYILAYSKYMFCLNLFSTRQTHKEVKLCFPLLPVRRQVERGIEGDDKILVIRKNETK